MTLEERFANGERVTKGNFADEIAARTLYTRNDINTALNTLSRIKGQGFKTMFVNYAFEKVLREEFDWDPDKDQDDWLNT